MTLYRAKDSVLLGSRYGAQRVSKRGTNRALGKLLLSGLGEPGSDIYPTGHPAGFVPEAAGDARLAQSLFVDQRADHPCLIQCRESARRRVRKKQ